MAMPCTLSSFAPRLLPLRGVQHTFRRFVNSRVAAAVPDIDLDDDVGSTDTSGPRTVYEDIIVDDALKHADFFGVEKLFTVRELFNARVHYGHKEVSLHPGMKQFVFGVRADQVIFDLDITGYHLKKALNVAAHIALRGGIILFITRHPQSTVLVEETAKECKEFAHTRRWFGREFTGAEAFYKNVTRLPDLLIFFSTESELRKEHQAVTDAAKMNIPTIGIVDSNCNPNLVTYPVPGNDDTPETIKLYCDLFKKAINLGKAERQRRVEILDKEIAEKQAKKDSLVKRKIVK